MSNPLQRTPAAGNNTTPSPAVGWLLPVLLLVILGIAFIVLVFSPRIVTWLYCDRQEAATAIELSSAVFSSLALAGVITALWLQRQELRLAHSELQETQRIFSEQRLEMKRSAESLSRQNFESTFFHMLQVIENIRSDVTPIVESRANAGLINGRQAIRFCSNKLKQILQVNPPTKHDALYLSFYDDHLADRFGQYFRMIYRILLFVDQANISDRAFYAGIVRAQMSDSELFMLFYNCISPLGLDKALPLIEKYNMFDNFSSSKLADPAARSRVRSRFADDPKCVPN